MFRQILFMIIMFLSSACFAYDLNGTLTKNSDGSYDVEVQNEYGHSYTGDAVVDQNDKNVLSVSVQDDNDQSYSGEADKNEDGTYSLSLTNDDTDGEASGTLTLEENNNEPAH